MSVHQPFSPKKFRSAARSCVLAALAAVLAFPPSLGAAAFEREMLLFQDIPDFITATKVKQPITEAPASATVFTDEQLKRMGARTLSDALRTVAGVYVSGTDRHFTRVHVRGIGNSKTSYNDKILLLIDGTPLRELLYGHAYVDEYLPLENVKRIEFIKGPGSALYGTNAFVGVINVITKNAEDVNGTEVSGGFGTQNTKVASIITGNANDPSKTVAFGRFYETRGLGMEFANNGRRNSTQSDPVAASTFWLKTSPLKGLTFSGEYIEFRHTQASAWDLPSEQWDRNEYTFKDFLLDAKYEKELSDSVRGTAKAWWHDFDDYSFYELNASSLTAQFTNYDIYPVKKSQTAGAQLEFGLKLPANNEAVAGAQFDWEDIQKVVDITVARTSGQELTPSTFWMDPVSNNNYAFYAEDIYKPLKWMDITLGVRNDNHQVFGSFLSPRGGVVMRPTGKSVVKLLYGEAYRAPAYREMYVFTSAYSSGNLGLKPERINTSEVELDYFLTKNLRTQLNYYQNKITDRIDQEKIGANYHWTNFSGETSVQGLEYLLDYTQGNTNAFLNASWTDAKDSNGAIIPSIPIYMANLGATYSFNENLSVSPVAMWVGYRPRTPDDTNSGGFDPRYPKGVRRPDLPQYTVVNLPVTYKVNNLELVLAVYNLFDTAYYVQPSNTKWNDYEQPRRTLTARAYYKF